MQVSRWHRDGSRLEGWQSSGWGCLVFLWSTGLMLRRDAGSMRQQKKWKNKKKQKGTRTTTTTRKKAGPRGQTATRRRKTKPIPNSTKKTDPWLPRVWSLSPGSLPWDWGIPRGMASFQRSTGRSPIWVATPSCRNHIRGSQGAVSRRPLGTSHQTGGKIVPGLRANIRCEVEPI
jgi:hypothetical protein